MSRQMKYQRSDNPYRRAGAFAQGRMYFANPDHVLYDSYITVIPHGFGPAEVIQMTQNKLRDSKPIFTVKKEAYHPTNASISMSELATWDLSLTSKNDFKLASPSFFWCGRPSLRLRRFQDIPVQIDNYNVADLNFWDVINELQRSYDASWKEKSDNPEN